MPTFSPRPPTRHSRHTKFKSVGRPRRSRIAEISGREAVAGSINGLKAAKAKFVNSNHTLIAMVGPLSYIGGKNRVARKIIALIPEHKTYIEPFCGGAQVFFHKEPSKVELLNDLNEDIFNFLRVCQVHYKELLRFLHFCIVSRRWFNLFEKTPPETLTDIQRAARFLFLQKGCYGGLVVRRNFTTSVQDGSNYNPKTLPELIRKTHERLFHVQLECLPYQEILRKCDRPPSFFYIDPPYFGKPYYRFNFEEKDYVELADRLEQIKGKFLLSLNDTPEMRRIFIAFNITTLEISYSSQRKSGKRYHELLISNYQLPHSEKKLTRR